MQADNFNTPILLISFNRPDHTWRVFEEIKKQKPTCLFVFQDAPRRDRIEDVDNCRAVRKIFSESIDWDCELKTFYAQDNLGCGRGPSSAITWFFQNVEQGIIFEDDCLPHPDFFNYCEILLEDYRENKKISLIGGANFQDGIKRGDGSYYFSAGHHGTWGWATWKDRWSQFDYLISNIETSAFKVTIKRYFKNRIQKRYWLDIYFQVKKDQFLNSCWDYQFTFSYWKNNQLAIIPNQNLICNIGFDIQATHTNSNSSKFADKPTNSILPLIKPSYIYQDVKADFYLHKNYVQSYDYGLRGLLRMHHRLNKLIKRMLNHNGSWIKKNIYDK